MSPTNAPPADAKAAAAKAAAAVIRRVEAADESAHDRLVRKHIPAWVISGAVHLCVIALLIAVFGVSNPPDTSAAIPPVTATPDKPEEAPTEFQEELGLDNSIEANLPEQTRIADKNAQNAAESNDTVGIPNTTEADPTAYTPPGLEPSTNGPAGVTGDTGAFKAGEGGDRGLMNSAFPGRSGAKKSELLAAGGGSKESELAVGRGLAWLARQQKGDGSWVFDAGNHKAETAASTGLALLPFLAAGQTHKSGKYQKNVKAGVEFLVKNVAVSGANAGRFAGARSMYAHAIATLALCEAYGMTKDKALLLGPCQAAINFIQGAQGADGGWRYQPRAEAGDTSVVGWMIQALHSGKLTKDIQVKEDVLRGGEKFLDKVGGGGSQKSAYGYVSAVEARPGTSMTAVGLLCRYYISGWGPNNIGLATGTLGLFGTPLPDPQPGKPKTDRRRAPKTHEEAKANRATPDMYYYYYATQVVHFFEGDEWKEWNEGPVKDGKRAGGMRDWLIEIQQKKDGPNLGSWDADNGHMGRDTGRLGTTCMCLLTLEVYYRHLPMFKRDNNAAK